MRRIVEIIGMEPRGHCGPVFVGLRGDRDGAEIGELLRALADRDGRTSLVVTHDERLTRFADRVLWLEDGALQTRRTP